MPPGPTKDMPPFPSSFGDCLVDILHGAWPESKNHELEECVLKFEEISPETNELVKALEKCAAIVKELEETAKKLHDLLEKMEKTE